MNDSLLFFVILCEVIGGMFIYRLWTRKQRPGIVERCLLSVILLIPFFGLVFYGFVRTSPDAHSDVLNEHYTGDDGRTDPGDFGHHH
ncbi:MAG TPA: hypothetical protein VGO67_26545 [Verrucomicrobiae bacterium]|jgi:hypothetical protein